MAQTLRRSFSCVIGLVMMICFFVGCKQENTSVPQEQVSLGGDTCQTLLSGAVTPVKDLVSFVDQEYGEVTITSRDSWDQKRLPARVRDLQKKGYRCNPLPEQFDDSPPQGDIMAEPAVNSVRWTCLQFYEAHQCLEASRTAQVADLKKQGFTCARESCIGRHEEESFVWFCSK